MPVRAPLLIALALIAIGCDDTTLNVGDGGTSGMEDGMSLDPPTSGVQIVTPSFTLQPGEEAFKCFYTSLPIDEEVSAVKFESWMTPGSHHLILYRTDSPVQPDGTLIDCPDGFGSGSNPFNVPLWLYAAQDPHALLAMPKDVGMPLKARQPLLFNMHYLNASPAPITVSVRQNIEFSTEPVQRGGVFVSYNTQIAVPAHGDQTVEGRCPSPAGAQFFMMSTHSHKFTTAASIHRWTGGQLGDLLVDTTDWERPGVARWDPDFATFATDEQIHYRCTYRNDTDRRITDGESANRNEMCMAVGYFFPATASRFCLNSMPFDF